MSKRGSLPLKPEFRPTLFEILGPRFNRLSKPVKVVAGLLSVLLLVALTVGYIKLRDKNETTYTQSKDPAFYLRYGQSMRPTKTLDNEYLRLIDRTDKGVFVQSFSVAPMTLPSYSGSVETQLPILSNHFSDRVKERFSCQQIERRIGHYQTPLQQVCATFAVVEEGRVRVDDTPGYSFSFKTQYNSRAYYGRYILLPEPGDHPTKGVVMEVLQTASAGAYKADLVGDVGDAKLPFRSFRYTP